MHCKQTAKIPPISIKRIQILFYSKIMKSRTVKEFLWLLKTWDLVKYFHKRYHTTPMEGTVYGVIEGKHAFTTKSSPKFVQNLNVLDFPGIQEKKVLEFSDIQL